MTKDRIAAEVAERIRDIADVLSKGKDCELRKDAGGIKVIEVTKKVVK